MASLIKNLISEVVATFGAHYEMVKVRTTGYSWYLAVALQRSFWGDKLDVHHLWAIIGVVTRIHTGPLHYMAFTKSSMLP